MEFPPIIIRETPRIFGEWGCDWHDGEFIGYIDGKPVVKKFFVKDPVMSQLDIAADDTELKADGQDATRIVFKVLDQAGNLPPYAADFIRLKSRPAKSLVQVKWR